MLTHATFCFGQSQFHAPLVATVEVTQPCLGQSQFEMNFETISFQLDFIKNYMDESLAGSPKALSMTNENRLQLAEALQNEVEAFFIVPNLLWAMWAMAQSVSTKITFGYWVRDNKINLAEIKKNSLNFSFIFRCLPRNECSTIFISRSRVVF